MGIVHNTVKNPGKKNLKGILVTLRLIASTEGEAAGFHPGGDYSIEGTYTATTDATGKWSIDLEPNVNLEPDNTFYEVTEKIPNRPPVVNYFVVPNTAGPFHLYDILVTPPASPAPLHENDLTAHLASSIVFTPVGAIAANDVQAMGQELDAEKSPIGHNHAGVYEPAGSVAAHAALGDPHPQYLTPAEGNAAYEPVGSTAAHGGALDPHPQYLTAAEGNAAYEPAGSVAAHNVLTQNVHGIADTGQLATLNTAQTFTARKTFAGLGTASAAVFPVTGAITRTHVTNTNVVLDTGALNAAPWSVWQQVGDSNGGTNYPLILQPLGSDVGVGLASTATPASRLHVLSTTPSRVGLVIQGAASQSAALLEAQNSVGTVQAFIGSSGEFRANSYVSALTGNASEIIIGDRGPANQSGIQFGSARDTNLYRSAADTLRTDDTFDVAGAAKILPSGILSGGYLSNYANTGAYLDLVTLGSVVIAQRIAANPVAIVRGAASQSANLQEWQNSAGSVQASVGPTGSFSIPNGYFQATRAATSGVFHASQTGDTNYRWIAEGQGRLLWGDGTNAPDTNLYRAEANVLATDDSFRLLSSSAGIGDADRPAEIQLRNLNATNNNYTLIGHDTANGVIGAGIAFRTLNHATRRSRIEFQTHDGAGSYVPSAYFESTIADTETSLLLRRNVGGTFSLQRVSMGAVDSGGPGFKLLRVVN